MSKRLTAPGGKLAGGANLLGKVSSAVSLDKVAARCCARQVGNAEHLNGSTEAVRAVLSQSHKESGWGLSEILGHAMQGHKVIGIQASSLMHTSAEQGKYYATHIFTRLQPL